MSSSDTPQTLDPSDQEKVGDAGIQAMQYRAWLCGPQLCFSDIASARLELPNRWQVDSCLAGHSRDHGERPADKVRSGKGH